jgi:hypothetical protein
MPFGFLHAAMLFGLITVIIPPIIHFLSRRRYDVVDWAAMQFLRSGERRRQRIFFEDLLLMLLRMALIGLFVLMLAGPFVRSSMLSRWSGTGHRDIVIILDGSYSMGFRHDGQSAQDRARQWLGQFLAQLRPGDSVAFLLAKRQTVPIVGYLTTDLERVRTALENLPVPSGNVDWPLAIQKARQLLSEGQRARREIVVISDGQHYGWADDATLLRWELLARSEMASSQKPRVWVVNVDPHRPADAPNMSLQPIRTNRPVAVVNREVTFRSALDRRGKGGAVMPGRVRVEIDGRPAGEIRFPDGAEDREVVPISLTHRFATPGSHLVTFILDDDALPGDNQQHYSIEVIPALPVLLVDGDERPNPSNRSSDFLRDALSPSRDPSPAMLVRVVPIQAFDGSHLHRDMSDQPDTAPRVVVFCDVPKLSAQQQEAVEQFLADRNGVLVTCGPRTDAVFANEQLYRSGEGWLPARLVEPVGDERDLTRAARPIAASLFHPAVEIFREIGTGGLTDAIFPRYWRLSLTQPSNSVPLANLTGGDPLLIERPFQQGRVILSAVPFDPSWRSNLTELPAFVPLVHELVFYLAGCRARDTNLVPGQAIRFHPPHESPWGDLRLRKPDGSETVVSIEQWPFVYEQTEEPGVYTIFDRQNKPTYFVVPLDPRESQLATWTEDAQQKIGEFLPEIRYVTTDEPSLPEFFDETETQEAWLIVLLLAIAVIFVEVVFTRRLARSQAL